MSNFRRERANSRGNVNYRDRDLYGSANTVSGTSLEERTTLTTPSSLFQRANSTASIETNITDSNRVNNGTATQKIIFQTAPRRSSVSNRGVVSDAKLIYYTSYGGKMEFVLMKEINTMGRQPDNDIVLSDVKISKHHACIRRQNNRYQTLISFALMDTKSSNGVRLNDNLIEPDQWYTLQDNDKILIGSISLQFFGPDHQDQKTYSSVNSLAEHLDLVTILPSEKKYENEFTIRAEIEAEEEVAFQRIDSTSQIDSETLAEDYEKLRMVYELSKLSVTVDINKILSKSLDLLFEILPILDRGVVLLVDHSTGFLSTHYVKLRQGVSYEKKEILLSSTILQKVFYSRKCLVTSDAFEDPTLGKAASVRVGQIRSVICVPLIAHNVVYGILHLDSRNRVNSYSPKDISLVKAIGVQTAMVIENMNLIKEVEAKAKITEQLSRFLPPHVVSKMTNKSEIIKKGGRELVGTVVFADIRGFTNLSEKITPMEVVNLLNEYFERLVKIVFKYDGVVDKYIGDAIMAVFGTLEDESDAEYRATLAAIEFQKAVRDINLERKRVKKDPISIGVGVNTGLLLAGFIGSSQRLEYTCIGDTVNTSSRICDFAAKDKVYISETTYEVVKNDIQCIPVGSRQFKGKREEVMIYEAVKAIGR